MTVFRDRADAAVQLASALAEFDGRRPLVVAIPRGAVPMGRIIADRLGGDLDVVLIRKLHAPGNPEFALGAIDETGWVYLGDYARAAGGSDAWIAEQKAAELATIRRRRAEYTPQRPPLDAAGRVVIVVDDGLATGATMIAALHALRAKAPALLVCAVPVASTEAAEKVRALADRLVCLDVPDWFYAVSQFYRTFPQVDDAEVIELLRSDRAAGAP